MKIKLFTKTIEKVYLLVLILFILLPSSIQAQTCTIQNSGFPNEQDQAYFLDDYGFVPDGQVFTACQTGVINTIMLKADQNNLYTGMVDFWIGPEPGNGNNLTGSPNQQFEVTGANITGVVTINLDTPFPVTAGSMYRMQFRGGSFRIDATAFGSDAYDGGVGVEAGTYDNPVIADMNFSITIEAAAPSAPLPLMDHWSLLFFSLSVMGLGIFFLSKKILS